MRVLIACICLFFGATNCLASPFYRETFKLCNEHINASKNAMELTGWKAFKRGSLIGKVGFLKINTPGSANHPLAYNSMPKGPEEGSAFWSASVSDLTVFTDEFAFDISKLSLVQYEQRLTGYNSSSKLADGTQLAFLIGQTWYISDQQVRQVDRGAWEPVEFIPSLLTYGTSPSRNGRGPDRPSNFGVKLPTQGIVTAFGIFLPNVTGRVRLDNFTLSDGNIDLRPTAEQGSAAQCNYIPTSISGEGLGNVPPTAEITGTYCTGTSARALGKIRADPKIKRQLLNSFSAKTISAKRDKAILALLLQNSLRIDNLVNVAVRDYYTVGTLQLINASGISKHTTPVKAKVQLAIDVYIQAATLQNKGALPLFQSINSDQISMNSSALCTNDLKKIVLRRAKAAKLQDKIKILT